MQIDHTLSVRLFLFVRPSAAVTHIAQNVGGQVQVQVPAPSSLGSTPRSGIAGSYGDSIFNILRNHQLFSTAAAPSYVPISHARVSDFSTSPPTLIMFPFLGEVILIGVKLYLVALIYISLVTSDVGHLFVCLLVVGVSSFFFFF